MSTEYSEKSALVEALDLFYSNEYEGHVMYFTEDESEKIADYLLKKGMVVPPIDVGDKLWYIEGGYYNASYMRPKEITVTEINKKKSGKTVEWGFIANNTRYRFTSFGKTVFWTEADCKAAIEKKKKSSKKFT